MCAQCESDRVEVTTFGEAEPVYVPRLPCKDACGRSEHHHACCAEGRRLAALNPCGICNGECQKTRRESLMKQLGALDEMYRNQALPAAEQARWDYLVGELEGQRSPARYRSGHALAMRNAEATAARVEQSYRPVVERVCLDCHLTVWLVDWVAESGRCVWCHQLDLMKTGQGAAVRVIPLAPKVMLGASAVRFLVVLCLLVAVTLIAAVVGAVVFG